MYKFENHLNMLLTVQYIASFWLVQELAELADGLTGCNKVAGGWCLVAWNFSVTKSTVLTGVDKRHQKTPETVAAQATCS